MMNDVMEILMLRSKLEKMEPEEILKMAEVLGYASVTLDLEKNLMIEVFLEEKRKTEEKKKEKILQETGNVQLAQEISDQKYVSAREQKRKQKQEERTRKKEEKRKKKKESQGIVKRSDRWLGRKVYRAIFLWVLFGCGFAFAVYKNFTGIDRHTVHEKEVVQEVLLDTNALENFASDFLKVYFSWTEETTVEEREKQLGKFLPETLLDYGMDMNRQTEKKLASTVEDVRVWNVKRLGRDYAITAELVYQLVQQPEEEETAQSKKKRVQECYQVVIHAEKKGMKVTRLPVPVNISKFVSYVPKQAVSDPTVEDSLKKEIHLFLKDFFQVYPSLKASDLKYYVKGGVMPRMEDPNFELKGQPVVAILSGNKKEAEVEVFVTYERKDSKVLQTFQYHLKLKKGDNWKIVDRQ